ncbi:MAG: D-lyxose/D-mannose family sugar isomerase [Christensenellaceae bacterium]
MKRSLINQSIKRSIEAINKGNLKLPDFAYLSFSEWQNKKKEIDVVQKTMMGWDVTDFGNEDFDNLGAVLFTIRNGDEKDTSIGTPYAEKLIVLRPNQRLPIHMHIKKSEDIINRGGADFEIKLYNTAKDGGVDYETEVEVYCDGFKRTVAPGEIIRITKGNSITLKPYCYHSFWGAAGAEDAVIGEVSSINDDNDDNCFAEKVNRFSKVDEDEAILCPLCNEYHLL